MCPITPEEEMEMSLALSARYEAQWARFEHGKAELPKEKFMTAETFMEHKRKAQVIIDRLHARCANMEGPHGE